MKIVLAAVRRLKGKNKVHEKCESRREIVVGNQVEVTSLVQKRELNGHSGIVLHYVRSRARWAVQIMDDVALRRVAASLRDAGLGGPLEAKSVIDFLQSVQHCAEECTELWQALERLPGYEPAQVGWAKLAQMCATPLIALSKAGRAPTAGRLPGPLGSRAHRC